MLYQIKRGDRMMRPEEVPEGLAFLLEGKRKGAGVLWRRIAYQARLPEGRGLDAKLTAVRTHYVSVPGWDRMLGLLVGVKAMSTAVRGVLTEACQQGHVDRCRVGRSSSKPIVKPRDLAALGAFADGLPGLGASHVAFEAQG
jgi:hypothetical protein